MEFAIAIVFLLAALSFCGITWHFLRYVETFLTMLEIGREDLEE